LEKRKVPHGSVWMLVRSAEVRLRIQHFSM
jgi:hypothetical protein